MPRPLDDIEFLARSENRVAVLETLSAHPQTRADLEASTGISKVTVGRVLEDFLERGWIRRADEEYRTTTTGDAIASDFAQLHTTVGTAQKLDDVAPYLEDVGFDVRQLEDAVVTVPDSSDPMAPFERPIELLHGADHVRFLTRMATPVVLEVLHEEGIDGDQTVEAVLSDDAVGRIREHPQMAAWARELLDTGRARAYRYDAIPHEVATFDGTVAILLTDEEYAARGQIETTAAAVREWFDAAFETYRDRAEPLRPDDFVGRDTS